MHSTSQVGGGGDVTTLLACAIHVDDSRGQWFVTPVERWAQGRHFQEALADITPIVSCWSGRCVDERLAEHPHVPSVDTDSMIETNLS
jgi:hypothetical protein